MWNIQLTKADKRKCRELIHIGLELNNSSRKCRS